jgi:hypothetical protein
LQISFNIQHVKIYLIMENHSVHNCPEILPLHGRYGVVPIWFPPDSVHYFQRLALQIFSSFKSRSANLHIRPAKPQLEGKLLRALHVWHNAIYAGVRSSAWRFGTIEVKRPGGPHHPGVVNTCTIMAIMQKAYSDAQPWFPESDGQYINRNNA